MTKHNLLELSENYFKTLASLWSYYRDEVNDVANGNNAADNHRTNNKKTTIIKSFEYKANIAGGKPADNSRLETEVAGP